MLDSDEEEGEAIYLDLQSIAQHDRSVDRTGLSSPVGQSTSFAHHKNLNLLLILLLPSLLPLLLLLLSLSPGSCFCWSSTVQY